MPALNSTRRFSSGILKTFWKLCRPSTTKPPPLTAPERACWPLWPLPDVLPWPEPGPRPIFLRRFLAPGAGRRSSSFMRHLEHVGDLRDHTPDRRIVLVGHVLPHAAESERLDRRLLLGREADDGAREGDPKPLACHRPPPPPPAHHRRAAVPRAGLAGA